MSVEINKLTKEDGQSLNIEEQNIQQLKEIFPDVFKEGKVDLDSLRAIFGEHIEDKEERYNFTWHGKNKARQIAQTPSTGTLRLCKEESVNWDTTQNLFIEGDNLEVLKLLQKSYHKKVKMIYIDPPYNTGKDFVYKDNYQDNISNYLELTGQLDSDGKKLSANSDTSGRYHSNWLNMMYPRLKLSRNLLKQDGVIFISIDEVEMANLKNICNEIFGEENHIADFVWKNKKGGGNDSKHIAVEHEYIVMYAKSHVELSELFEPYKPEYLMRYKEIDDTGKFFWDTFRRKSGKQYYPIQCPDGTVLENDKNGNPISWLRSENRFYSDLEIGDVRFICKENKEWTIHFKQRLPKGKKPRSVYLEEALLTDKGTTGNGSDEVLSLFGKNVFPNPKPIKLIEHLLSFNIEKNDIVLDLFAGSGTTAQAVYNSYSQEKESKFILIQLPEKINDKTEEGKNALSMGYKLISEISKDRMRKAIKISDNKQMLGFKVFKLDKTNINQWEANFDNLSESIDSSEQSIKEDRSQEDVLYEILLKYGLDLTYPIKEHIIAGKTVFDVAFGSLIVCLDNDITKEVIEGIGQLVKELDSESTQIVFKDYGFANDAVKVNAIQSLKQYGIDEVKSI